jgi:hypothetical protein
MLGRAGVVKLWSLGTATQLALGEGLETTLSAMNLFARKGEDLRPAWAALSAGTLAQLPLLPGVEQLILFVDHDNAGESAAMACTARWQHGNRVIQQRKPEQPGTDFNDLIFQRS